MKRNRLVGIILILLTLSVFSCGLLKGQKNEVGTGTTIPNNLKDALSYLATNLDAATFLPIREGWQFDYGFKEGWILNKYEYIRSLLNYKDLQALVSYPIYVSGPHSKTELDLNSSYSFGHYNPKFVAELHKNALQLMRKKKFIATTKPVLEKYSILDFLQRHKAVYEITQKHPEDFNSIKLNYIKGIKDKTWPESAYRSTVPKMLDDSYYWNWSETSYHFWVRRDIDGTKDIWIGLITDVLDAYDRNI
ncbi:hypothetical protein N9Y48_04470 [Zobellia sp.]|nr:hypothetical protein [Zobellia sp.]